MATESRPSKYARSRDLSLESQLNLKDNRPDSYRPVERILELIVQRDELFAHISAHLEIFGKDAPEKISSSLHLAIQEFHNFFVGYTNYFFEMAYDVNARVEGRSRESILTQALDNTRQLWGQLSQAINQRFNPVYADRLAEAGTMAQGMLKRVGVLVNDKQPIIYFDKSFQITRHPFQTNPLIGISLDRFKQTGEASFAHELGHHVFWNNGEVAEHSARVDAIRVKIARIIFQPSLPTVDLSAPNATYDVIRSRFQHYEIWSGWIEEVFADVFGTFMLGPKFAKGIQDIIIREWVKDTPEMIHNDGEHPMPALRPYVALATLQHIAARANDPFGSQLKSLVLALEDRWEKEVWGAATKQNLGPDSDVILEDLRTQVSSMVQMILEEVKLVIGATDQKQSKTLLEVVSYWGKEGSDDEATEIENLLPILATDRITIPQNGAEAASNQPSGMSLLFSSKHIQEPPFDQFLDFVRSRKEGEQGSQRPTREEWMDVLDFDLSLEQGANTHTGWDFNHGHPKKHRHKGLLIHYG